MTSIHRLRLARVLVAVIASGAARSAQADDPTYKFDKKEEVKVVVWKASAQAGLIITSGNSSTVAMNGGLSISRYDGWNKIALDANGAFAQSQVRAIADGNKDTFIDPTEAQLRNSQMTSAAWLAKFRYDRFFTERNSGYVNAFVGQDLVAGNSLLAGGQIGYSRLLVKTAMNELAAEIGYDLSYLQYVAPMTPDVVIHSGRLFVGYVLTVSESTAINASVEGLFNGNDITVGPDTDANSKFTTFQAFRINGKAGLSTKIYKNIGFHFGFAMKYNNAPAPLSLPMGTTAIAGSPIPRAEKLDTVTDAGLVVTFL